MATDATERALREQLVHTALRAYRRGLVAGSGGNVSARLPGRDEVLITPTGLSLESTTRENLVRVRLDGEPADPACPYKPSKETGFHCGIYRLRPDVQAIVHLHPPYATAFSTGNRELPLVTVSAAVVLGKVPCVPVALSGSAQLRRLVEQAFGSEPSVQAVLMQSHGIIAVGPSLAEAYDVADLVEATAQTAYLAAALGFPLPEAARIAFSLIADPEA